MEPALFVRTLATALASSVLLSGCAHAMAEDEPRHAEIGSITFQKDCKDWDDWDKPAEPFRVFGNTYYVGTCGIAAILIVGEDGHVLIDTGTEAGAEIVLANIRKLGIDPRDIELLLTSHEHFDHVGGMAKLQQITGARVISSDAGIYVLSIGTDHPEDPQAGMHEPMARISRGTAYDQGDAPDLLDAFGISPLETPGHTPGAMTWSWQSCEGNACRTIVYADSLSPVSSDDYRFSDHPEYVARYRTGLAALAELDCDILLTPHPSASQLLTKLAANDLASGMDCAAYSSSVENRLDARLAKEAAGE